MKCPLITSRKKNQIVLQLQTVLKPARHTDGYINDMRALFDIHQDHKRMQEMIYLMAVELPFLQLGT